MKKKGKRIKGALELISREKSYSLEEALNILSEYAAKFKTKFDETVEMVLKLGVDTRQSDQIVRGMISMPSGLGKSVKVAVFTKEERVEEARSAGADLAGGEDFISEVKSGKINFDVCISTPDIMGKVASLGKILGPKGLMPNPKLGTVSDDIEGAVKAAKSGQVEYKADKFGLVHAGIGKLSFSADDLKANMLALYKAVLGAKPSSSKGVYMKSVILSSTHGPSLKVDLSDVMS